MRSDSVSSRSQWCVFAALGLLLLSSGACSATVAHTHLTTEPEDQADRGIRYFGTSPYLIAYSDGKGGIVTQISYLPDPAKKMSARPSAKLADAESTLTFDRGVLTSSVDKGDATAVPKAIAKAVETFAPALLAAFNKTQDTGGYHIPAPYIFKIVVQGNDVSFLGGQGDEPIKITLLPQDAKE